MSQKENLFFSFLESNQWNAAGTVGKEISKIAADTSLQDRVEQGVVVKPIYHKENLDSKVSLSNNFPSEWLVGQIIVARTQEACLLFLNKALKGGVDALTFFDKKEIDLATLLKGVKYKSKRIEIVFSELPSLSNLEDLISVCDKNGTSLWLIFDPIHDLIKSGNWKKSMENDLQDWLKFYVDSNSKSFKVSGVVFQNAGATIAEEIAFCLAQANEYLLMLSNKGIQPDKVCFEVSIGGNYFFEIAKIHALRSMWSLVSSEYDNAIPCEIIAQPSKRNMTLFDFNLNMLRSSTAAMASIIGGTNVVNNLPYDEVFNSSNDFGNRIARNQLLILKHECYFDKLENPAKGAYFIEQLVNDLSENILEIFKDIERLGGFIRCLETGYVQERILISEQEEQKTFDEGSRILVGTNKYQNLSEVPIADLLLKSINQTPTSIRPIIEKRLSEKNELKRIEDGKQ
jgi:methylmalonyl-CoA mutase